VSTRARSAPRGDASQPAATRDRRLEELIAAVVHGPGTLPSTTRRAILTGEPVPGDLARLVAKVADGGLAVTDDDVAALLAGGYGEDAVFECVVAAAVAAGVARLRAVERLLAEPS
jgi:alkylhydroperoxidase family enzyme